MPATAKIVDQAITTEHAVWVKVIRDPNRDREYDDQPVPPDVAQALIDLAAPTLDREVTT